jgi:hypothetical protein
MAAPPNYQLRIGDTAPALECTLKDLPADLDSTSLRLLFRLPGSNTETTRNATSFDVVTGKAVYQWESADFPNGTKAGRVSIRWDFETTADRRGTTDTDTFALVS